jgi:para-nitrobenzyl esterase
MSRTVDALIVNTTAGAVRGSDADGVAAFRGIAYAAPPVGPLRFAPTQAPEAWEGVRSAEQPAVCPPQPPGRAELLMGPLQAEQDEDCLTLNVWAPSDAGPGDRLPVLVFFHGGGFMYGGGAAPWYDGSVMARRGRMVVVTVNYRLGALGYLYLPPGTFGDRPVANMGLLDQLRSLEWVRDNIDAFGGDPNCVTVSGQSAGGISIVALKAMPAAVGLFHRAIPWSSGLSMPAKTPGEVAEATELFLAAAGVKPGDGDALLALPVEKIVAAQEEALIRLAMGVMSRGIDPRTRPLSMAPFQPVLDGVSLTDEPVAAARAGSFDDIDLFSGCNAQEMRFAYASDPTFWDLDRDAVIAMASAAWGEQGVRIFEAHEKLNPGASPPDVYVDMVAIEGDYPQGAEILELRPATATPGYFGFFTWRSPAANGRLGACHTCELPFVFNNLEQWSSAPMVTEGDPDEVRALSDRLQDAWIAFAATGDPGFPAYVPPDRAAMEFGTEVRVINDPIHVGTLGGRGERLEIFRS